MKVNLFNRKWFFVVAVLSVFVFIVLPILFRDPCLSILKPSENAELATVLSYLVAIIGFIGIIWQLDSQRRKERIELVLKLSSDFFNNDKFMAVFNILDSDHLSDCNALIKKIINGEVVQSVDGEKIYGVKEIHLNAYMNFFNSLAILKEEGIVEQSDIMKLFRYQLERTFASVEMIRYMEDYGFERIKSILPQSFFFYGTLQSKSDREVLEDFNEISSYLSNGKGIDLSGYKIVPVGQNDEYKGLVKSRCQELPKVKGRKVCIERHADWTKLFDKLDCYEEVDSLYIRAIIEVKKGRQYVWVYLKK
jgi:hypothetical protein